MKNKFNDKLIPTLKLNQMQVDLFIMNGNYFEYYDKTLLLCLKDNIFHEMKQLPVVTLKANVGNHNPTSFS